MERSNVITWIFVIGHSSRACGTAQHTPRPDWRGEWLGLVSNRVHDHGTDGRGILSQCLGVDSRVAGTVSAYIYLQR